MYFYIFLLITVVFGDQFGNKFGKNLEKAFWNGDIESFAKLVSQMDKNSSDYHSLNQTLHLSKNILNCVAQTLRNANKSYDMKFVENCHKDMYLLIKYVLLESTLVNSREIEMFRFFFGNATLLDVAINENKSDILNATNKTCAFYDCVLNNHNNSSCELELY